MRAWNKGTGAVLPGPPIHNFADGGAALFVLNGVGNGAPVPVFPDGSHRQHPQSDVIAKYETKVAVATRQTLASASF
jgi:hypothetical protein